MQSKGFKRLCSIVLTTCFISVLASQAMAATAINTRITDLDAYLKNITSEDRQRIQNIRQLDNEQFKLSEAQQKSTIGDFISIEDKNTNRVKGLNIPEEVDLTSSTPLSVIVEFKQEPIGVYKNSKESKGLKELFTQPSKQVEESHRKFRQQIYGDVTTFGINNRVSIEREFQYAFNGVAMVLPANQVAALLELDTVKAVFQNKEVKVDPINNSEFYRPYNSNVSTEDSGQSDKEKLHSEGITGKGIKVGVIDTGIDYNHPDLKDIYKGGYDFVDDDNDPMETTYDDWLAAGEPENRGSTYYTDHGTHVSGIIAGTGKNNSKYAVTGVAPEVDLYAYRVLGPYGSGATSDVIAGIDKAVKDGMDVVNLSLGSSINDPYDPTSIAANNAALAGTVPVVAGGNAGNGDTGEDMYTVGTPGSAPLAITVGAYGDEMNVSTFEGEITTAGETVNLNEFRVLAENYTNEVGDLGTDSELEYVDIGANYFYRDKDVEGKIVLIQRGGISLNEKIFNAKRNKAKAAIIINNNQEEGYIPYFLGKSQEFIPTFNITNEQGTKLLEAMEKGTTTISFKNEGSFNIEESGVAVFSSRGPTRRTYDIKPEVVSPGVTITSSVPSYINGPEYIGDYEKAYASKSGTSMASPYVAGLAALVLQANPEYTPEEVKLAIMNTADSLKEEYSVYDLGAGKVDLLEAAYAEVNIGVENEILNMEDDELITLKEIGGDLSFGYIYQSDKPNNVEKTLIIENNSNTKKTFETTVHYNNQGLITKNSETNGVKLNIASRISVDSNGTTEVNAAIYVPVEAEIGNYEGYVTFTNIDNPSEVYRIPFGVNNMLEGIKEVLLSRSSFTTRRDMNTYQMGYTDIGFTLSSSMEKIDIILKNADTQEPLGLIFSAEGFIEEGYLYGLDGPFTGLYFPFTGNPDCPVDFAKTLADPGRYEVELIATDMNGKAFKKSQQFFIENTLPKTTMKVPGGVYEVNEEGLSISGAVFDSQVEILNKYGIGMEQDSNSVMAINYNTYEYNGLNLNTDGSFEFNAKLAEGSDTTKYTLYVSDYANNSIQDHPDFTYNLVKEGTPYLKLVSDKNDVKYGESFTVTLSQHNIEGILDGEYTLNYDTDTFEIENVIVATKDIQDEAVTVEKENLDKGAKITLHSKGEITAQTADTAKDLMKIQFKVKDEPGVYAKWIKEITIADIPSEGENLEGITINKFGQGINVLPNHSQLISGMYIEGFIPDGYPWMDYEKDHYNAGIEAYLIDKAGNRYDAEMISDIRFLIDNLPVNTEEYELVTKIPGHFDRRVKVGDFMDYYNGEETGKSKYIFYPYFMGGDVNKDDVIDILDVVNIYENLGTSERNADINFDGVVDKMDMKFVQTNYQKINPWSETNNKPATVHDGLTLEDILTLMDGGEVITGDQKAANVVIELIKGINTPVTLGEETAIAAAREGYNALTEAQKALVTNYADLEAAEKALAEIKAEAEKEAADKAAANKVIEVIKALPKEVTLESEGAIAAARAAYEALTEEQKVLVTNYADLKAAETALAEVKAEAEKAAADKAAADKVIKIIEALPKKITLKAEKAITAARKAYNELTEAQKALVDNYKKLQAAEKQLQKLKDAEKNNKLPQTGAMAGSALMTMAGLAATGAGAVTLKRKNNKVK